MKLNHVRSGKPLAVNNPIYFFAQERDLAEEAFAGDVIGIPNHGTLRVGDTLTEGETFRFTGLPSFAPEVMRRVRLEDTMRMKQLRRALEDLAEEGLVQVFKPIIGSNWIVGVVGPLQLDVLASRIKQEYKTDIGFEPCPIPPRAGSPRPTRRSSRPSSTRTRWRSPRTATGGRSSCRRATGNCATPASETRPALRRDARTRGDLTERRRSVHRRAPAWRLHRSTGVAHRHHDFRRFP